MSDVPEDWHIGGPSRGDYFRHLAHKLIYIGYQFSLSQLEVGKRYEEPDITGFIRQGIRDYVFTRPGFDGFHSEENRPEISKNRIGKQRKMPDLVIQYTAYPRLELVCEAKRLNKNSGRKDYVDSDGMGCFIGGLYAIDQTETAMIGYVETESVSDWKDTLWQHIEDKGAELELLIDQENVSIIIEISNEWQSKHRRDIMRQPVTICHILLAYIR